MIDLSSLDSVISDMDYAKKCKALRSKMKLSQDDFAKVLGYSSYVRISEIENGSRDMSLQGKKCLTYLEILVKNKLI